MTAPSEMEAVFEAILFVGTEPIPRERLLEVFDEPEREAAAVALDAVLERHRPADGRGLVIEEVGGGYRLATRPEINGWLRRFFEAAGANKLSMAALETLAIVAYRQPITGPEIQDLRSVSPVGVLKTLLEKRMIRIAGRKAVVGKPFLYSTTREFLMHFGLRSIGDLPPLEEFEEAFGDSSRGSVSAVQGVLPEMTLEANDDADRDDRETQIQRASDEILEQEQEQDARDDEPVLASADDPESED